MKKIKSDFKSKADMILDASPQSIQELLDDDPRSDRKEKRDGGCHEPGYSDCSDTYTRVHVHIRQDLANKVLDLVYARKKSRHYTKKEASQKAVIEEALECYFENHPNKKMPPVYSSNFSKDSDSTGYFSAMIKDLLTSKEIQEIDMVLWGSIILKHAQMLSFKVENELIQPLRLWLNDSEWAGDFHCPGVIYNWQVYKKRTRQWDRQQKQLAQNRLRHYLDFIRSKAMKEKQVSSWLSRGDNSPMCSWDCKNDFLTPIIGLYSRFGQRNGNLKQEFLQYQDVSELHLYPWQTILTSELSGKTHLSDLKVYIPENPKKDTVCKLITLLQLETDGVVSLEQSEPFQAIQITNKKKISMVVSLKDEKGNEWQKSWDQIDRVEKDELLQRIKTRQVICKPK